MSGEDDDLSNNPFLAFFGDVNQAKRCIEASLVGHNLNNKFSESQVLVADSCKIEAESTKQTVENDNAIINDYLQRIFLITLNPGIDFFSSFSIA